MTINIDLDLITKQIMSGMTIMELKDYWGCSRTYITEYKKNNGLVGLSPNSSNRRLDDRTDTHKICSICLNDKLLSEFYSNGYTPKGTKKYKSACKECSNSSRKELKKTLILEYLNNIYVCADCSITNVYGFLEFHHLRDKLFTIGLATVSSSEQFNTEIVPELDKCVLLCPNCHKLRHLMCG